MRVAAPPIPCQQAKDGLDLDRLRAEFAGRWEITRHTDHGGTPGAWHAIRLDPAPALQGVRASTAQGLRWYLNEADAARRHQ